MASKVEHIELLRQYYDIYSILEAERTEIGIWDLMPFSEERQWWVLCWNVSNGRIEVAQNIYETMDIVELFEKYSMKLSLEYIPKGESDG